MEHSIFVSINLSTNQPENIRCFLENVELTADTPEEIEVLIHIDKGDFATKASIKNQIAKSRLSIKYIETSIVNSFADLWKVYDYLQVLCAKSAYFCTNFSDEFRFETKGWDTLLKKYKHYYKDDIFRIRCSKFKYRNYFDFWECGHAPDSLAFYTKKWIDTVGTWCPCLGPDSFQQLVAFYMHKYDNFSNCHNLYRDIPEPFLKFSGEGANRGLEGDALKKRARIYRNAWHILMSRNIQEKANLAAMKLIATIESKERGLKTSITKLSPFKKLILLDGTNNKTIKKFSYNISYKITLINLFRKPFHPYYCSLGRKCTPFHIIKKSIQKIFLPIAKLIFNKTLHPLLLRKKYIRISRNYYLVHIPEKHNIDKNIASVRETEEA